MFVPSNRLLEYVHVLSEEERHPDPRTVDFWPATVRLAYQAVDPVERGGFAPDELKLALEQDYRGSLSYFCCSWVAKHNLYKLDDPLQARAGL